MHAGEIRIRTGLGVSVTLKRDTAKALLAGTILGGIVLAAPVNAVAQVATTAPAFASRAPESDL